MDNSVFQDYMQRVRQTDMVTYLSRLGIEPARISGTNYWYHSPFRNEKTPSFKVNRGLNRWFDFGEGAGGNLIDFGIRYHQCSVGDFLSAFREDILLLPAAPAAERVRPEQNKIRILQESQLQKPALLSYLAQRCIDIEIAKQHCRQIDYELSGKTYYAIGFANDSGGYELRNAYSKISTSPKDITTLGHTGGVLAVFEGFFDFLSYRSMHRNASIETENYLVLNSVAFFPRARGAIEAHRRVDLYLDLDQTGKNLTSRALAENGHLTDKSGLYQGFKDLNEFLVAAHNQAQKSRFRAPGLDLSI